MAPFFTLLVFIIIIQSVWMKLHPLVYGIAIILFIEYVQQVLTIENGRLHSVASYTHESLFELHAGGSGGGEGW